MRRTRGPSETKIRMQAAGRTTECRCRHSLAPGNSLWTIRRRRDASGMATFGRPVDVDRGCIGRFGPPLDGAARPGHRGGDHRHGGPDVDALVDEAAPIGAEFIGLARLARQRYHASVAVSPAMQTIATFARAAYGTHRGTVSPRTLAFVERRWRILDPAGLVVQTIVADGRTLAIRDVRAVDHMLAAASWAEGAEEGGICLCDNSLRLERRRLSGDAAITTTLSLHCLGRFFQRQLGGVSSSLDALAHQLSFLADAAPPLLSSARSPEVHLETPSGSWHGHIARDIDGKRRPWLNLRTFY
jgi:hypothetical protein